MLRKIYSFRDIFCEFHLKYRIVQVLKLWIDIWFIFKYFDFPQGDVPNYSGSYHPIVVICINSVERFKPLTKIM